MAGPCPSSSAARAVLQGDRRRESPGPASSASQTSVSSALHRALEISWLARSEAAAETYENDNLPPRLALPDFVGSPCYKAIGSTARNPPGPASSASATSASSARRSAKLAALAHRARNPRRSATPSSTTSLTRSARLQPDRAAGVGPANAHAGQPHARVASRLHTEGWVLAPVRAGRALLYAIRVCGRA